MRTPINVFLASLSLCQFVFTVNYWILALLNYLKALCYPFAWSYVTIIYKLVNVHVNLILHSVALVHILSVAAFRIRSMQPPIQLNQFLYGTDRAFSTAGMIWLFAPMFCIPIYFSSTVTSIHAKPCHFNSLVYEYQNIEDKLLVGTVFWMFGVALKFILTMFSLFLLLALTSSEEYRRRIRDSQKRQRRISSILSCQNTWTLPILLIFLTLVELPHGLFNFWQGVHLKIEVRPLLRGHPSLVVELSILLLHSMSFFVYWLTSAQFRETLQALFSMRRSRSATGRNRISFSAERCANEVILGKQERTAIKLSSTSNGQSADISTSSRGFYPTIIISNESSRRVTEMIF